MVDDAKRTSLLFWMNNVMKTLEAFIFFISSGPVFLYDISQLKNDLVLTPRHIQNPVKSSGWNFLRKWLMAQSTVYITSIDQGSSFI